MNEQVLTDYVKYLLDQRAQLELMLIQEKQKNVSTQQPRQDEAKSGE